MGGNGLKLTPTQHGNSCVAPLINEQCQYTHVCSISDKF